MTHLELVQDAFRLFLIRKARIESDAFKVGKMAMADAIEAANGAFEALREEDMVELPEGDCAHEESERVNMSTMGSGQRFYCNACKGFWALGQDGVLFEYQEKAS